MVTRVETRNLPTMVMPSGFHTYAPTPEETAMGIIPKRVVKVVISTGLRRFMPAWVTA